MKKFLLSIVLISTLSLMQRALGQACTVSKVSVQLNSTSVSGTNCVLNITLTFSLAHNAGNKFIWMHLWKAADYPGLTYSKPPSASDLALTLANIGINNSVTPQVLLSSYTPAPSVVVEGAAAGLTVTVTPAGTVDIFTVSGIKLTAPGACNTKVSVKGDVWSTQSASMNNVQCFSNGLSFIPNDPIISGFKRCTSPRTLALTISSLTATDVNVTYTLYKDDGDGIFEPGTNDVQVGSGGPFTINSSTPYNNGAVPYTGNSVTGEISSIWVAVSSDEPGSSIVTSLFKNTCSILPVNLAWFNAKRTSAATVELSWQTLQEENSRGFEVQRQVGDGAWQVVTFVPSKANNGNSNSALSYNYIDNNTANAISQYRLREVDIDGNSKFSETKSVRGESQTGRIIVFPNPSSDGTIKVSFEDLNGTRDAALTDMNGRVIKQWSGLSNNNLEINNLTNGYYSLRVIVRETGEQSVQKIIVSKH